jgi:hypothetical protein
VTSRAFHRAIGPFTQHKLDLVVAEPDPEKGIDERFGTLQTQRDNVVQHTLPNV